MLRASVRKVLGSSLSCGIGRPHHCFRGFPQSRQTTCRDIAWIVPGAPHAPRDGRRRGHRQAIFPMRTSPEFPTCHRGLLRLASPVRRSRCSIGQHKRRHRLQTPENGAMRRVYRPQQSLDAVRQNGYGPR
jgi:hypothetical protein